MLLKALIGMRLNSNWSLEGQYTNFSKDTNALTVDINGTSVSVIHIDATYIHTLKLNTIFDCLVNFPI
jgi:hypothetical protein